MCYPFTIDKNEYDILFWSQKQLSSVYEGEKINSLLFNIYGEPEIIRFYKKGYPLCLGVQGHPEMIPDSLVTAMINDLLNELVDENREIYSRSRSRIIYT